MAWNKYIYTLKFRLVAFGIFLVVFGVGLRLFLALPFVKEQVRELVTAQQMALATYVARDVDQKITARLALIGELASALPLQQINDPESLRRWLRERQQINPLFNSGLMLVPINGHGLIGEYPVVPGRQQLDYASADWFQSALRSNRPTLSKPRIGRATSDPLIIMAAPVRDQAGKTVAVIAGVALLNTAGFLDQLQETRIGTNGGFLLISPSDKLFVAASDPEMILKPTPPAGVNLLHDKAMAGFRGADITINAKGVEELAAIVSVPSTGWFVVARLPTSEAFRLVDALRSYVLQNSLAIILVMLIAMLLVLPRLFRPLTEASNAMRQMADGDLPLQLLPVTRADEVGDVVAGFNHLLSRLMQQEQALKASEARLSFMAHHDPLTQLPNRTLLEDRLEQAAARSERDSTALALLFCDLDGFKAINDTYGHETGDRVLIQVAERLGDGRRRVDTVARLGGDEFIILLTDLNDAQSVARLVAEQCISAIAEDIVVDDKTLQLGISIGIAIHHGPGPGVAHLLSRADSAMYEAKRGGKGCLVFFDKPGESAPRPS